MVGGLMGFRGHLECSLNNPMKARNCLNTKTSGIDAWRQFIVGDYMFIREFFVGNVIILNVIVG